MLFKSTVRPKKYKNADLTDGDWQSLADWIGISADTLEITGTKSLKEVTVYTCIKILSETLAKLPLKIYQDKSGVRKASDHYLYTLLKLRPNPYMSAVDFWKCLETQRNIYGNAYAAPDILRNGKIIGLYPLDASRMSVYVDDVGLLSSSNSVWYIYTDNAGVQHKFNSDEILHFKGVTTNGLIGLSVIESLRGSIENAKASEDFLNNSYKNGMQSAGIINYVGDLSPAAENTFREKFEQMSSGLKNANRISLLPIGYQYQSMALKLTDAQFLENSRFTIQQLTAAYGIKPHQVNDQTKTSFASTAEANREFYTDTLLSILTMYEQELTYKLFLDKEIADGYYVKFNADVILRADQQKRYAAYAVAVQNGFKKPNEIRAMEEDPPDPDGDQLIVNGNCVPLSKVGAAYEKGGTSK